MDLEWEKYIPIIRTTEDLEKEKTTTLTFILKTLMADKGYLRKTQKLIEECIDSWCSIDETKFDLGEKENLFKGIDNFLSDLVDMQMNCKDTVINRLKEKIERLEATLEKLRGRAEEE